MSLHTGYGRTTGGNTAEKRNNGKGGGPGAGCHVPGSECRVLSAECQEQSAEF